MDFDFDITKIEKLALSKYNKKDINFTEQEISFMSNIFNTIINSEDYNSIVMYLAAVNGTSVSIIKFIKNIYLKYFADADEKRIYYDKIRELKSENRKKGFIDFSIVITLITFISVIGITIALLMYKFL